LLLKSYLGVESIFGAKFMELTHSERMNLALRWYRGTYVEAPQKLKHAGLYGNAFLFTCQIDFAGAFLFSAPNILGANLGAEWISLRWFAEVKQKGPQT